MDSLVGRKVRVGAALLEVVGQNAESHEGGNGTVTRSMPLQGSSLYRVDFSDGGYGWYGADQLWWVSPDKLVPTSIEPIKEEQHG